MKYYLVEPEVAGGFGLECCDKETGAGDFTTRNKVEIDPNLEVFMHELRSTCRVSSGLDRAAR